MHPGKKTQAPVAVVGSGETEAVGLCSGGQVAVHGVVGEDVVVRGVPYVRERSAGISRLKARENLLPVSRVFLWSGA